MSLVVRVVRQGARVIAGLFVVLKGPHAKCAVVGSLRMFIRKFRGMAPAALFLVIADLAFYPQRFLGSLRYGGSAPGDQLSNRSTTFRACAQRGIPKLLEHLERSATVGAACIRIFGLVLIDGHGVPFSNR